jgi:hypothetical protein
LAPASEAVISDRPCFTCQQSSNPILTLLLGQGGKSILDVERAHRRLGVGQEPVVDLSGHPASVGKLGGAAELAEGGSVRPAEKAELRVLS